MGSIPIPAPVFFQKTFSSEKRFSAARAENADSVQAFTANSLSDRTVSAVSLADFFLL